MTPKLQIRPHLPPLFRINSKWNLLYSLDQHGISLATFYSRTSPQANISSCLVVMKDADDRRFGVWMGDGIKKSTGQSYYGSGESSVSILSLIILVSPSPNLGGWLAGRARSLNPNTAFVDFSGRKRRTMIALAYECSNGRPRMIMSRYANPNISRLAAGAFSHLFGSPYPFPPHSSSFRAT